MKQFIGRLVSVKINDRDEKGKVIWNKFTSIKGKCVLAGYNSILEVNQITIDRTPIFPVKEEDITILD